MKREQLIRLAHGRSGDKGDTVNVGVIARHPDLYPVIKEQVTVKRVVCAVDCGMTVNPKTIEAQIEGGVVFGISAVLYGEITLKDGRVEQSNFTDYRVLRMNETPPIEVHIVQSTEAPGGIGEPGTAALAPAVTNAIFAATGKRVRKLPVGEQLKTA